MKGWAKLTHEFLRTRKLSMVGKGECDYPSHPTYLLNEVTRSHLPVSWSPGSEVSVTSLPAREEDYAETWTHRKIM